MGAVPPAPRFPRNRGTREELESLMPDQIDAGTTSPVVAVQANDRVAREGLVAFLAAAAPRVRLVPEDRFSETDVAVIIEGDVSSKTFLKMKEVSHATSGRARIILVADTISESQFARAVGHGMVAFLIRPRTGLDRILKTIIESHQGQSTFPPRMTGALLNLVRRRQHDAAGSSSSAAGFTPREVSVLALLAVGLTTTEIAAELDFSEQDVKGTIQAALKRRNLRNRTHAVAYAIRLGVL